ncbi:hypothetical protein DR62_05890 [Burkholderia thailandensis]|nr:hypothetical protein DR62_05890 [Burkholderia thailandensis]AOI53440.1 hypothetical protein WI24_03445 [Burkholderia thailandensis]AOJ47063.1 hypothetical protein WJ27_15205 [Burkholderia thailandensis]AOJ49981.1 hypothetical protein AQ475_03460 [Burkholderia thailandensis]AOJ57791.1 hypothetical protein AQ477_15660 [Burkholderia thailandensis]
MGAGACAAPRASASRVSPFGVRSPRVHCAGAAPLVVPTKRCAARMRAGGLRDSSEAVGRGARANAGGIDKKGQ